MDATWQAQIEREGYAILQGVFSDEDCDSLIDRLSEAIDRPADTEAIRSRQGSVYAARNVLALLPAVQSLWQRAPLENLLNSVLGSGFGLVRGLYFDKPPERSWSLPWHKDRTIAVVRNDLPSTHFTNPTRKAGVHHVIAPNWLLESMLTLRIHLDAVTVENGPLVVMPGSHHENDGENRHLTSQTIFTGRGDVLAMRPLLSHSSLNSTPGTTMHRRTLHLEFAAGCPLPDGYQWHDFLGADATICLRRTNLEDHVS